MMPNLSRLPAVRPVRRSGTVKTPLQQTLKQRLALGRLLLRDGLLLLDLRDEVGEFLL